MRGLGKRGWFLAIALLWGSNAMADSAKDPADGLQPDAQHQSQASMSGSSTSNRGDLNLDGISFSVADWVMTSLFTCIVDPGPWPPLDVQEQADCNCSGEVTIGDLGLVLWVLLGIEPPYNCPTLLSPDLPKSSRIAKAAAPDNYTIEIRGPLLVDIDTGWVEVVLVEAPDIMTGFQFNIEYDSDRLELIDGVLGDHVADWMIDPYWWRHEKIVEPNRFCLRIAGISCLPWGQCQGALTLPSLPATLARLKFRVRTTNEDFATDLNFAWDYCSDNGISVGPEFGICGWWPYYLAVSDSVYSATGVDLTGTTGRYGGAGDDCMLGGSRDVPVRQIVFRSGTLTYQQSCCVGFMGDVNMSGDDEPTIGDVSAMIDARFISGICDGICIPAADFNGSGGANPVCDDITIGDISILIDCLFITGDLLPCYQPCPGNI